MINSKGWLWLRRRSEGIQDQFVTTDLDTLATALYVRTDDLLKESPQLAPCRPEVGIDPKLSDAELLTLAVMQALLGLPPRPAGCGTPVLTCGTCSRTCLSNPAITSGCALPHR
jgi:hypothetical protein